MQEIIEKIYFNSQEPNFNIQDLSSEETQTIEDAIQELSVGKLRVCEKIDHAWITHQWIKKAILMYFPIKKMKVLDSGIFSFVDKIPLKKWIGTEGVRVVPHALVRVGAFINQGVVLMPSYVNIGAYVDSGSMVDTWATVGSCAQIGKNVHLSGGVGIGGVLEPVQANPVIIEDNCFIGSRCIIVEGVHIEEGAVLGAGVTITASTPIIDVTGKNEVVIKGHVPKNSVVIPGTRPKEFGSGTYNIPCALIIGQRSEATDKKTSLTKALRDNEVSV